MVSAEARLIAAVSRWLTLGLAGDVKVRCVEPHLLEALAQARARARALGPSASSWTSWARCGAEAVLAQLCDTGGPWAWPRPGGGAAEFLSVRDLGDAPAPAAVQRPPPSPSWRSSRAPRGLRLAPSAWCSTPSICAASRTNGRPSSRPSTPRRAAFPVRRRRYDRRVGALGGKPSRRRGFASATPWLRAPRGPGAAAAPPRLLDDVLVAIEGRRGGGAAPCGDPPRGRAAQRRPRRGAGARSSPQSGNSECRCGGSGAGT